MKRQAHNQMAMIRAAGLLAVLFLAGCCSKQQHLASPTPGFVARQGKLEQPLIDQMAKLPANTPAIRVTSA